MDGHDLMMVLSGHVALDELLRQRRSLLKGDYQGLDMGFRNRYSFLHDDAT